MTKAVQIPFSTNSHNSQEYFVVDKEDAALVARHSWHVQQRGNNYYIRCSALNNLDLHRLIKSTGNAKNIVIDHINGIWWDNCKENLRLCTKAGNNRNIHARRSKYSDYIGIMYQEGRTQPWKARLGIQIDNRRIHFSGLARDTAEEAAADYDVLALTYHGEFANLNFPGDYNA